MFDRGLFLANIAFLIEESNIKIGELESKIGVSKGYFSRQTNPSIEIIMRTAETLNVSVDELLKVNLSDSVDMQLHIAETHAKTQWKSIKECLPPVGMALIVTIDDSIRCRRELRYPVYYRQSFYGGDYGFYHFADEGSILLPEYSKVLAWMPLPPIYEEERR